MPPCARTTAATRSGAGDERRRAGRRRRGRFKDGGGAGAVGSAGSGLRVGYQAEEPAAPRGEQENSEKQHAERGRRAER
ncbi:MAG: hypothetical protein AB1402_02085 [Bacillota bacterium]